MTVNCHYQPETLMAQMRTRRHYSSVHSPCTPSPPPDHTMSEDRRSRYHGLVDSRGEYCKLTDISRNLQRTEGHDGVSVVRIDTGGALWTFCRKNSPNRTVQYLAACVQNGLVQLGSGETLRAAYRDVRLQ